MFWLILLVRGAMLASSSIVLTGTGICRAGINMAVSDLACATPQPQAGWLHNATRDIKQARQLHLGMCAGHATLSGPLRPLTQTKPHVQFCLETLFAAG